MYGFSPVSPYPALTSYNALITPATHQVYAIIERGTFKDREESKIQFPALVEALKRKYPVFSVKPGKPPDAYGFYPGDIENEWDISMTGSSYKLAAEGDRFVFYWIFKNGRSMSPEVDFMIGYVDNKLKAIAKSEFKQASASDLESRIKKTDSSGL
jgi:hypothetical protein